MWRETFEWAEQNYILRTLPLTFLEGRTYSGTSSYILDILSKSGRIGGSFGGLRALEAAQQGFFLARPYWIKSRGV